VDASVVARWLIDADKSAEEVLRRGNVAAPSLLPVEVANALVQQVRSGRLDAPAARGAIDDLMDAELEFVSLEALVAPAFALAIELGLTVYDAAYVALAELRELPLVTADRRLAGSYDRAELLS
jgi:predicted nucleic acid-binding protein